MMTEEIIELREINLQLVVLLTNTNTNMKKEKKLGKNEAAFTALN